MTRNMTREESRKRKASRPHTPIRTCIACGAKRPQQELLRLALDSDGVVKADRERVMGGRGAYVCSEKSCLARLAKHRKLGRIFRKDSGVRLHPSLVYK